MSKIFEMLQKGQGEISESILRSIEGEQPQPEEDSTPDASRAQVLEVLGDSVPPDPFATLPDHTLQGAIRQLPICISGSTPLLPFDDGEFVAAEQYRIIRTRLIQHPKQPRMILVSSPGPNDGKSVTAVNLAGAMSLKTEANVLLADTEFRRSVIHARLGFPASPGLADVLTGKATLEEALIRTEQFPNLYVIPSGEPLTNPSELLDSTRWARIANQLRNLFHYVVADSPPVASVADYELLQAVFDGVVLVVRPDHTGRQVCLKALELIPKGKLIGVVMNCVPKWLLHRGYHYEPYCTIPRADQSPSAAGTA